MQDRERGVVWEETIIFLPSETKMVFLSATLSNAAQFAAWVAALHRQPCHVVYTDFRPTPLQHYAFAPGAKGLHLVSLRLMLTQPAGMPMVRWACHAGGPPTWGHRLPCDLVTAQLGAYLQPSHLAHS